MLFAALHGNSASKIPSSELNFSQTTAPKDADCMSFDLEDNGDEYALTIPMCGEWNQYATFFYNKSTGEILEGSSGDSSEECTIPTGI